MKQEYIEDVIILDAYRIVSEYIHVGLWNMVDCDYSYSFSRKCSVYTHKAHTYICEFMALCAHVVHCLFVIRSHFADVCVCICVL